MRHSQRLLKPLCAALFSAIGSAHAGGFGVTVQSATGGGNAATGHALAEDASAMLYNPALLMSMEGRQFNSGITVLVPDSDVQNAGSTIPSAAAGFPVIGDNSATLDHVSVTPSFFYRGANVSDNLVYGIGVNVPFGSSTEYDDDSFVRYEATESELKTLNINPAVAWRVNEKFDIGAGLNIQVGQATLDRAVDAFLVCQRLASASPQITPATCDALGLTTHSNAATDSSVSIEADAVGYGVNVGAAYHPSENMTISLGLRSKVDLDFEGDADFKHRNLAALGDVALDAANLNDQDAETDLEMPASASLAVVRKFDKLAIHGDVTWTEWSSIPEIRIKFPDTDADDSVTNLQWEDTVRVGLGMTYQYNERMKLRAGIARDPAPMRGPENRTPRSPTSDNLWFSGGFSYKLNKQMDLDAGFSVIHPEDTAVNYTAPGSSDYTTRATVESDAYAASVSLNYRF